jgi:hypothetical protein
MKINSLKVAKDAVTIKTESGSTERLKLLHNAGIEKLVFMNKDYVLTLTVLIPIDGSLLRIDYEKITNSTAKRIAGDMLVFPIQSGTIKLPATSPIWKMNGSDDNPALNAALKEYSKLAKLHKAKESDILDKVELLDMSTLSIFLDYAIDAELISPHLANSDVIYACDLFFANYSIAPNTLYYEIMPNRGDQLSTVLVDHVKDYDMYKDVLFQLFNFLIVSKLFGLASSYLDLHMGNILVVDLKRRSKTVKIFGSEVERKIRYRIYIIDSEYRLIYSDDMPMPVFDVPMTGWLVEMFGTKSPKPPTAPFISYTNKVIAKTYLRLYAEDEYYNKGIPTKVAVANILMYMVDEMLKTND